MRVRGRRYAVEWGHLVFATLIAAAIVWYLFDAGAVSVSINNLLLVAPTAAFALLLYLFVLPQCFRRVEDVPRISQTETSAPDKPVTDRREMMRVLSLGAALGLFVFSLDQVGFDVAIWLFTLASMFICGERKPLPLVAFPSLLALAVVYGFKAMMPFPMPTTIL